MVVPGESHKPTGSHRSVGIAPHGRGEAAGPAPGEPFSCQPDVGTLGPYLVKTPDNPEGIDASVFSGLQAGIEADRPATLMQFLKNFCSVGGADGRLVSDLVIQANWTVAINASPIGTLACVDAWLEDFREDISRNDLPTMIIHGDDDHILPADVTSRRQAKMIKGVRYIEIKGGSHGLPWTHAEEINAALVEFLD
jgi:non-heme chloroperoxidase